MRFSAIRCCWVVWVAVSSCALFAQADVPLPETCTEQDKSFVNTFHAFTVSAALLAAFLSFYAIPHFLRFRAWWLTRSPERVNDFETVGERIY